MDAKRLDSLAKMIGRMSSRRAALRAAVASALAITTAAGSVSAKKTRGGVGSEACIQTGKRCPATKPRGTRKKKLSCDQCCQRHFDIASNGKKTCACQPEGLPCTAPFECCAGICENSVCKPTKPACLDAGASCKFGKPAPDLECSSGICGPDGCVCP